MAPKVVAFVGKIGHGKTSLLNKLTGKRFLASMGARTCTTTLQHGYTRTNKVLVIDTPGFCVSEDVAAHIGAQKLAIGGVPLSGIYLIVKFGRSDEIAELASKVMGFVGNDDIRIIVTFADTALQEAGYDSSDLKSRLSQLLGIKKEHIAVVGKDTNHSTIETFIGKTLHDPREFVVSESQVAQIASLSVAARRFIKPIDEIYAKIAAASKACCDLTVAGKSYESDTAVVTIQHATTQMVQESKEKIFREAQDLDLDQQNVVYGKAGLALSLRLKSFVDATNRLLSWDVTDPSDGRSVYKKCNNCGAIYNKTEGCDEETTCGAIPRGDPKKPAPLLDAHFATRDGGWIVEYYWDGVRIQGLSVVERIRRHKVAREQPKKPFILWLFGSRTARRSAGSSKTIESGCGAKIAWNTMLPVEPKRVQMLGHVEVQRPTSTVEDSARVHFAARVLQHEHVNRKILDTALVESPH